MCYSCPKEGNSFKHATGQLFAAHVFYIVAQHFEIINPTSMQTFLMWRKLSFFFDHANWHMFWGKTKIFFTLWNLKFITPFYLTSENYAFCCLPILQLNYFSSLSLECLLKGESHLQVIHCIICPAPFILLSFFVKQTAMFLLKIDLNEVLTPIAQRRITRNPPLWA